MSLGSKCKGNWLSILLAKQDQGSLVLLGEGGWYGAILQEAPGPQGWWVSYLRYWLKGEAKDPLFMDNKYWGINHIKKIKV